MTVQQRIAVIPGDGIGKEVVPESLRVLQAAATRFDLAFQGDEFDCNVTPGMLGVGLHPITADYNGDANNAASTTTFEVNVYSIAWLSAILPLILGDG